MPSQIAPSASIFRPANPLAHLLVAVLLAMALLLKPVMLRPAEYPDGDAPRYIVAALNLYEHGVIASGYRASPPEPGLVIGGPLIAAELALAMALDPGTHATFRCVAQPDSQAGKCPLKLTGMALLHFLELVVFAACVWWAGWLVFARYPAAWLAMLLALLCREVTADAGRALTEPMAYALLGLFLVSWIRAWQAQAALSWLVAGVALGFLLLAKPAAAIILPLGLALLLLGWLRRRSTLAAAVRAGAALGLGCFVVLLPWMLRNASVAGAMSLSDPSYLATTFAHRIAYNRMSWPEWLVAWIYYLPDFGDDLATRWFAPLHERLGWGDESLYVYGRDQLYQMAAAAAPLPGTSAYLLREFVLQEPFKHAAVTLLLAWRGLFIGKLWALVALMLLPAGLAAANRQERRLLLLLLAPGIVLVFAQAVLSVSIPRYNNALVLPLALVAAGLLSGAAERLWRYWRAKARRRDR